jgi:hypothetical protein
VSLGIPGTTKDCFLKTMSWLSKDPTEIAIDAAFTGATAYAASYLLSPTKGASLELAGYTFTESTGLAAFAAAGSIAGDVILTPLAKKFIPDALDNFGNFGTPAATGVATVALNMFASNGNSSSGLGAPHFFLLGSVSSITGSWARANLMPAM